jgi:hypothetical protein
MSTPTNIGEDNLDKYPLLKRLMETPDHLIPDDDHPFREPIFTEEEEEQLGKELLEKLWNPDGSLKKPLKKRGE